MRRPPRSSAPTVVLLHGLGRTRLSMQPIARAVERGGYQVANLGYPSRRRDIATLAESIAGTVRSSAVGAPLHFVTHSLGGIVLRVAVAAGHIPAERIGRVVMLAPPNGGSELPDELSARPLLGPLYRFATGPAGSELGVGVTGVPGRLPPVEFELGVIAGARTLNPAFSLLIPGANDGKVSVERARVAGMRDFLVVPHSHTFLIRAPAVLRQVVHFLDHGAFLHDRPA